MKTGILSGYGHYLPLTDCTPSLSLGEGDTPLVRAEKLSQEANAEIWLKVEGGNPTGSFKDRGMVVAVAKAIEEGSRAVICASTGNTSASAAAYAAKAGIQAIVIVPSGKIALGKLAQALIHGAQVVAVQGNFDQALDIVRDLTSHHPVTLVNSLNPNRIEGQKTAAFEICEALDNAPDILALPVGNAGNITAYWKGFREWQAAGHIQHPPELWGFQAAGAAPIVHGAPIEKPQTIATGHPHRQSRKLAASRRGARRIRRAHRSRDGRRDPGGTALSRREGRYLLRARLGGPSSWRAQACTGRACARKSAPGVRSDRERPQGPTDRSGPSCHPTGSGSRCERSGEVVGMVVSKVVVRVPATTANLGPGFDCLGMALGLHNTVSVQATHGRLDVRIEGEGAEDLRWGEENRVLRAIRLAFEEADRRLPSLALEQKNNIPLGRGLGSSAAATVAGLVAANALCGSPLSADQILMLATQLEGHPDNVAPALLGGLVIAVQHEGQLLYNKIAVPVDLKAALFVPDFSMPTADARRVLPTEIPRSDAVYNLGRVALLVAALIEGHYEFLDAATHDRLHQPYREVIFPAMPTLLSAAREAGALGAFLSGAGSTVLALCRENAEKVAEAMADAAQKLSLTGQALVVPVTSKGAETTVIQRPRRRREPQDHW